MSCGLAGLMFDLLAGAKEVVSLVSRLEVMYLLYRVSIYLTSLPGAKEVVSRASRLEVMCLLYRVSIYLFFVYCLSRFHGSCVHCIPLWKTIALALCYLT